MCVYLLRVPFALPISDILSDVSSETRGSVSSHCFAVLECGHGSTRKAGIPLRAPLRQAPDVCVAVVLALLVMSEQVKLCKNLKHAVQMTRYKLVTL